MITPSGVPWSLEARRAQAKYSATAWKLPLFLLPSERLPPATSAVEGALSVVDRLLLWVPSNM